MKTPYGTLKVVVKAEEDEIDGDDELELSDRFTELEDELYDWLKLQELSYPEFEFDLLGG